jgi:hypothetical protein
LRAAHEKEAIIKAQPKASKYVKGKKTKAQRFILSSRKSFRHDDKEKQPQTKRHTRNSDDSFLFRG